jgi:hypothetical protein
MGHALWLKWTVLDLLTAASFAARKSRYIEKNLNERNGKPVIISKRLF